LPTKANIATAEIKCGSLNFIRGKILLLNKISQKILKLVTLIKTRLDIA
jgi:hypothetical protein